MAKNDKKKAKIFHFDLNGKQEDKYDFLNENSLASVDWSELKPDEPNFFFVNKDFEAFADYEQGFKVNELFPVNNVGIVTSRDSFVIDEGKNNLENRIKDFFELPNEEVVRKFDLKENKSWKIDEVKNRARFFDTNFIKRISYRPFDNRYIYYNILFIERSRTEVMQHFLKGENVGISLCKQFKSGGTYQHIFISNQIIESSYVSNKTSEITSTFPLYLYPDEKNKDLFQDGNERIPNLNMKIVEKIVKSINHVFLPDEKIVCDLSDGVDGSFSPLDLLDYIYAVLHSPTYREKYKEFLKIDFPRVPYPKDADTFWQLVKLGGEIRQIHLLESSVVENYITQYPMGGDNVVGKPKYVPIPKNEETGFLQGNVFINETQYFANVPLVAWKFYIGGYQPAQKWLKDRKDRKLEFEDILHYQKIIVALSETNRLMKEIDNIEIE